MAKGTGRHPTSKLDDAKIRSMKTAGMFADGNGLYLKVDASGNRRWVQRIVIRGKRTDLGLGSYPLVRLAEARRLAEENRRQARQGEDPLEDRRRAQAVPTFEEAARKVHADRVKNKVWKNAKHQAQWIRTLEVHAFPVFGRLRVSQVKSHDLMSALEPIWHDTPETAKRVLQRIGAILKWAIAKGYRLDNPADTVPEGLGKPKGGEVKHHAALPYEDVAEALKAVHESKAWPPTKAALEFLALTACRSGEVRLAAFSEVDFDNAVWTIPADRMKAGKEHAVPLSPPALAILKAAKEGADFGPYIFPGTVKNKPLSDMTLSKLMKELKLGAVPHGFRTSFRVWAAEQTNFPSEIAEAALAHVIKSKTEKAYNRSALLEKRRLLMAAWATYLNRQVSGKVVQLGRGAL